MKYFSLKNLFLLLCLSAPFIYLLLVYDDLPTKVATHFGSDMKPDKYGDKSELWTAVFIIMGVSLITYLVITNVSKIDPKNQTLQSKLTMEKLGLTIVAFMSVLTMYIIYSTIQNGSGNILFVLMGGFFAVIGNFLHSVKPNYFVGLRLPWTLENEDNWRKTHQLGGKVWVIGGLLIAIMSLIIPVSYMFKVFILLMFLMVLIPGVFSFKHYQKGKKN
jgi:uncharacterized membrane protein